MHDESLVETMSLTSATPLAIWKLGSLTNPHISKYDFKGVAGGSAMSAHAGSVYFVFIL